MFRKFVVYLLLFSFTLQIFPERVFAVDPTPAPSISSVGWYKTNKIVNGTIVDVLRFYYDAAANTYIDFVSSGYSDVTLSDMNSHMHQIGKKGDWNIWFGVQGITVPKIYIISDKTGDSGYVRNLCFKEDPATLDFFSGKTIGPLYKYNINNEGTYLDCFTYFNNDGSLDLASRNTKDLGSIYSSNIDGTEGSLGFKKIQNGGPTNSGYTNNVIRKSDAMVVDPKIAALCTKFFTSRQVTTADDANKWIDQQITYLLSQDKDQTHAAITAIQNGLKDDTAKAKIVQSLISFDATALHDFYGTAGTAPTVVIGTSTGDLVRKKWDDAQALHQAVSAMDYFSTYLQFSLMKYYVTVNSNYRKCLLDNGAGDSAMYNASVLAQINALVGDIAKDTGTLTATDKYSCPSIMNMATTGDLIGWSMCQINGLIFQTLKWFVGQANALTEMAIGFNDN